MQIINMYQNDDAVCASMQDNTEHEGDVQVLNAKPVLQKPPLYEVVILNDDYTPMDFVVHVLTSIFKLSEDAATMVMLSIHHKGKGVAGVYPKDIAETKCNMLNGYAQHCGHPLVSEIQPQQN